MKKILLIGGTGCTGILIAEDILKFTKNAELYIGSRNIPHQTNTPNIKHVPIDISKEEAIEKLCQYNLVILAMGPFEQHGSKAHEYCIKAKVPCIDINDSISVYKQIFTLNTLAKKNNTPIYTGMGLSPGLTTYLLLNICSQNEKYDRIYSRVFVGGNQNAGKSAIKAMLHSLNNKVPEIVNNEETWVKANRKKDLHTFPKVDKPSNLFHYTSPEVITLHHFKKFSTLEHFNYKISFQGMPSFFVRLMRTTPNFIKKPMISTIASIIHRIQNILKKYKQRLLVVEAYAKDKKGEIIKKIVAESESSYYATAVFAGVVTELFVEDQLKPVSGVLTLEDEIIDFDMLREKIEQRNITIYSS